MAELRIIDADTHVDETDATWEYIPPEDAAHRPTTGYYNSSDPGARKRYWLIDGHKRGRANRDDNVTRTTVQTRELLDVEARLRHMDELGVEAHVIYPTLFIRNPAVRPEVELSLARSYNRWMADRCAQSRGRLRWVCVPSLRNMDETLAELRFARDHGACGVMKKGDIEADHEAPDAYFFPLYEEAERLNMPICFHTGTGQNDFGQERPPSTPALPFAPIQGIYSIVANAIPARFPKLRFGAIEAGASWLPLIAHRLSRGMDRPHLFRNQRLEQIGFEANRIYVTCEIDEDFPMLLQYISEDNLLVGSDYSHHDISQQHGFSTRLQELAAQGVIPQTAPAKMMWDNPKAFYGL